MYRSLERAGDNAIDLVMVREVSLQVVTLLFSIRRQEWIVHGVICDTEIVVALSVADAVDGWRHDLHGSLGDGSRRSRLVAPLPPEDSRYYGLGQQDRDDLYGW